jgi:hypothetical protein
MWNSECGMRKKRIRKLEFGIGWSAEYGKLNSEFGMWKSKFGKIKAKFEN